MVPEGFPVDKLSKPQYKVTVEKDVFIEMRDGVKVAVDIYRPDAPGEFPALYASSPYQKDLYYLPPVPTFHMRETNKIEWFVERGYCYINHDIRGSGKSVEGQWRWHSLEEQRDHYDVIEWIAAQPWCTGKVGMIGESYYAWTQWMAAAQAPPHLACIVPFDGGADMYRDVAYHGGIMATGFPAGWHITELRGHYRVGRKAENATQGDWDLAWNVINHQTCDDFWQERNPDFDKIACPVFSVGILHKVGIHLRGNLRGYEEVCHAQEAHALPRGFRRRRGGHLRVDRSAELAPTLVRPLAQGQRHRHHGRAGRQRLRAGQGALPSRERVAAGPHRVHQAVPIGGEVGCCGLPQRRRPELGRADGGGRLLHLLLPRSRLDRVLRESAPR